MYQTPPSTDPGTTVSTTVLSGQHHQGGYWTHHNHQHNHPPHPSLDDQNHNDPSSYRLTSSSSSSSSRDNSAVPKGHMQPIIATTNNISTTPNDRNQHHPTQEWTVVSPSRSRSQQQQHQYPHQYLTSSSWDHHHSHSSHHQQYKYWYEGGNAKNHPHFPHDTASTNQIPPNTGAYEQQISYHNYMPSSSSAYSSSSYWNGGHPSVSTGHDWRNHQHHPYPPHPSSQRRAGPPPASNKSMATNRTTTASQNIKTEQGRDLLARPVSYHQPSTTDEKNLSCDQKQDHHQLQDRQRSSGEYINPIILDLVDDLDLPSEGRKFSTQNWKDALLLLYRWRTTTTSQEKMLAGAAMNGATSTNAGSGTALCSTKSVKSFCEKVLYQKQRRRQFSIHWKDSGLKRLLENDHDLLMEQRLRYDDPHLQTLLDDYFSGRKRTVGYQQAKEKALAIRQRRINKTYDELTNRGTTVLARDQLFVLQNLIEEPFEVKVEIEQQDGQKVTHHVCIEGFGGSTGTGSGSSGGGSGTTSKNSSAISRPQITATTNPIHPHQYDHHHHHHPFDEEAVITTAASTFSTSSSKEEVEESCPYQQHQKRKRSAVPRLFIQDTAQKEEGASTCGNGARSNHRRNSSCSVSLIVDVPTVKDESSPTNTISTIEEDKENNTFSVE